MIFAISLSMFANKQIYCGWNLKYCIQGECKTINRSSCWPSRAHTVTYNTFCIAFVHGTHSCQWIAVPLAVHPKFISLIAKSLHPTYTHHWLPPHLSLTHSQRIKNPWQPRFLSQPFNSRSMVIHQRLIPSTYTDSFHRWIHPSVKLTDSAHSSRLLIKQLQVCNYTYPNHAFPFTLQLSRIDKLLH